MKKQIRFLLFFAILFSLFFANSCSLKIFRFDKRGTEFYDSLLTIYKTKGSDSLNRFVEINKDRYSVRFVELIADKAVYSAGDTLFNVAYTLASALNKSPVMAYVNYKLATSKIKDRDYKGAKVLLDSVSKVMEIINWDIVKELNVDRIDFYLDYMEVSNALSDQEKANEYYKRILFWYKVSPKTVSSQKFLEATVYLSESIRQAGKFSEAMDTLESGYKQYKIPMSGGKSKSILNVHYQYLYKYFLQKGKILESQKQYSKALLSYETALGNISQYKSNIFQSKNIVSKTSYEISLDKLCENLNQIISDSYLIYASAEKKNYFDFVLDKTVLKFKSQQGGYLVPDYLLEDSTMLLILTGDAYLNKYNLKYAKGMYKSAELRLSSHQDSRINYFLDKSYGDLYFKCLDYNKALDFYNKFCSTTFSIKDTVFQYQKNKVLEKMFESYLSLNKPDSALFVLNLYAKNISGTSSPENKVILNMYKGDYYRYTGKADSSEYFYTLAEQLNDSNSTRFFAEINERLGYSNKKRKPELAEDYFYNAMQVYSTIGDYEKTADMLLEFGNTFESRGDKNSAMELYLREISLLELVRHIIHDPEMKKYYNKKINSRYNAIIEFFVKNNFPVPAYIALESYKSRMFLDLVAENFFDLTIKLPISTKIEIDDFDEQYNAALLRLYIERLRKNPDLTEIYELSRKVDKLQYKMENFKTKIKPNMNVNYMEVKYPKIADIHKLNSENTIQDNECVIRYFECQDTMYCSLIYVNQKFVEIEMKNLGVSSKEIDKEIDSYHKLVKFNNELVLQPASILYDKLIRPLGNNIKDKKLIIIADKKLSSLPFEALYDSSAGENKYLIEKNSVKYIQSVSLLSYMRKYLTIAEQGKKFIGFGDPVFDYKNFLKGKNEADSVEGSREITRDFRKSGGSFTRLPATRDEVSKICKIFKETKAVNSTEDTLMLRVDANEQNAKAPLLSDYSYIHFASHGVMSDNLQAIVLSQLPDSTEDGFLTTGELLNFKLHAKLVSFSACRTGLGDKENLNGIPGFTSAIMYAGSQAAIVTLWSIEDYSAKNLMLKFYDFHINGLLTKEDAMRQAKISFINSENYRHPFYWAGFVMYGE
ncbi:MAG: CHAT domain-containing protein [Bacteroidota bacterium]